MYSHTYTNVGDWKTLLKGNSYIINNDTWIFFKYDTIRPESISARINANYYFYMKNPLVDRYDTLLININDNGWGYIQKDKLEIISYNIHYNLERVK